MIKKDFLTTLLISLTGVAIGVLAVLNIQALSSRGKRQKLDKSKWGKLELVLEQIDANYVDEIDYEKAGEAAITAVLGTLDPHSVYMPPQTLEASETELAGNFDGIGIQFNVPNDTAIVLEVIPGGPSEKIGLRPGDRLMKVDSINIAGVGYPQDSMVRRMRGLAGTKVEVTVKRGEDTIPFEITRGKIPLHSVDASFMVNDTTGYIKLAKFSRNTFTEFRQGALDLLSSGMKKLIVDLRDNSGGFLDQALNLSNLFLDRGQMIVYMEGEHRAREEFKADGRGFLRDVQLVVIIDEGSASSSEIFAGAIQDNHRGTILGRRSFGKGLVQEPVYFSDGSGVRLTVARFYTPSGRCLQKPYGDDYGYEILRRYEGGEMLAADSMKVENGGILPDVFVPVDTTKASDFYIACRTKATTMRFASAYFDSHGTELGAIDDYDALIRYLDRASLESRFLSFARQVDGLVPEPGSWNEEKPYLMAQVRALVGRYSKLGDAAYYHLFVPIDRDIKAAIEQ
ncbi:MAG: S41 family peptidase [Bacteroidales bacterium]|nr:S41 family peptidase [Bacteroidales bacterium]